MSLKVEELPNDTEELKSMVVDYKTRVQQYSEENERLQEKVNILTHRLHGRSSEKLTYEEEQQSLLFDEAEAVISQADKGQKKTTVRSHSRKKPGGRAPLPEKLERKTVEIDIDEKEKTCDCGSQLDKIGQETTEQLELIPAKLYVKRFVYPKYACRDCHGDDMDRGSVKTSPKRKSLLPKSQAAEGFLAWSITNKFVDHLPFYRQEKILSRYGIDFDRTKLCNWTAKLGDILQQKIMPFLWQDILHSPILGIDETPFTLLKAGNKKKSKQGYMWVFYGRGGGGPPIIIFEARGSREPTFLKERIQYRAGPVITDGYAGYNFLDAMEGIRHAGCMAHVRRKFYEADVANRDNTLAKQALSYIGKLYDIEREAKENSYSDAELLKLRQDKSVALMNEFYDWIQTHRAKVVSSGALGKALEYAHNQWPGLEHFLQDPKIPIDNNELEHAIRPFTVGRKNWLFSGSKKGADASGCLYTLIETAKAAGHDPYWYLRYLFVQLPQMETSQEIQSILPYNISPETCEKFF